MSTVTTAPARVALLHTTFPCCGGKSRFTAVEAVPKEAYDRTCRRCGQEWTVRRTTLPTSDFARQLGTRFDSLVWSRRPAGGGA